MKKVIKILLLIIFLTGATISSPIRNGLTSIMEVKPISKSTLNQLNQHKEVISHYADKYDVPKEAISASIGSEINRRIYINKITDYFQDIFFASSLCTESLLKNSLSLKIESRYINISKQDVGLGNIKFQTAWDVYLNNQNELPNILSKKDLVNYLLTDSGNIHIASLVILEAKSLFSKYCTEMDKLSRNNVYYSYYKQGESYYIRYKKNSTFKRPPIPGEGREILEKLNTTMYKAH
jgi:hypothetical protein